MKRRLLTLLSACAGLAVLAGAWAFFAPSQLGGSTSYATTYGTSMEPRLHAGDLAILRPGSGFRVGEVVAYHSRQLNRTVLHRIVAERNGLYTFKGDNNGFLDPEHVRRDQLEGRLWFRVPHGGAALSWLSAPLHSALLVGFLGLLAAGGAGRGLRRRSGDGEPRRPFRTPAVSGSGWQPILAVLGVAAAASLLLGVIALTRPTTVSVATDHLYAQHGIFSYASEAPPGPVYGRPTVRTGDAVFVRIVPRVRMRFAYTFAATSPHGIAGTAGLDARISDGNGWQRTFPLGKTVKFAGDSVTVGGPLNVAGLGRLVKRFEDVTGAHSDSYRVTLVPRIEITGTVAGQPIHNSFSPPLAFDLDPYRLALASAASGTAPAAALMPSKTGGGHLVQPRTIAAFGIRVSIASARPIAEIGFASSLLLAGLLAFLLWRTVRRDEPSRIKALYGSLLVPVTGVSRIRARTAVGVATIEALVSVAKRYETVILHEASETGHAYVVEAAGVVYRYTVGELGDEPEPPRLAAIDHDFGELGEPSARAAG